MKFKEKRVVMLEIIAVERNFERNALKDDASIDTANLPKPDVLVAEIIKDLEEALGEFNAVEGELKSD